MLLPTNSLRAISVLTAAAAIAGAAPAPPSAPSRSAPPGTPSGDRAFALRATGVQIYTCAGADTGPAWRLTGPQAELRDSAGALAARHFAGPTWQAPDSSSAVVGEPVASSPAPRAGAVPWVVLRATAHSGSGAFARAAGVTRPETAGGAAPAAGGHAAHAGQTARVPYSATYTFFPAAARP